MNCRKCGKLHKFMIKCAEGIRWSEDPPGSMRYSSYVDGRIEDQWICPICLKDIMYGPIGDTSDGVPVNELQEGKDNTGTVD